MGWGRSPRLFVDATEARRLTTDSLLHSKLLDYCKVGEVRH